MMNLKEVLDIQFPESDYIPQTFLLYYITRKENKLYMQKLGVLRETADETITKTESLPEFDRWCTQEDIKNAMGRLLRWSYNCT